MPNEPYTVFDGYRLTLHRSDGSVVASWPAISGVAGHQKPSEQGEVDVGPLPEGSYSFPLDQIQSMSARNFVLGLANAVGQKRGAWPGATVAWGTQRAFLVPNASTDTRGRRNFSIHGGFTPGSEGCIDVGPNEETYFAAVQHLGGASHRVIVRYDPRLEKESHPLASQPLFNGALDYFTRPLFHPPVDPDNPDPGAREPPRPGVQGQPVQDGGLGAREASQPTSSSVEDQQVAPTLDRSGLPQRVIETGNLLRANGIEITPRTMYVSHVLGPQAAVDLIKRTGSTSSDAVPSADRATGDQMRAWVRALRLGPAAAGIAGGMAPAPAAGPAALDQSNPEAFDPTRSFA